MRSGVVLVGMFAWVALAHGDQEMSADLLSPADRLTLRSGRLVARVVDTEDRTEIMSLVAIHASMDLDRLVDYARSPLGLRRTEDSLGDGRLSSPPVPEDFTALRLDEGDLEQLERCRVGNCRVRLTAEAISRLPSAFEGTSGARTLDLERAFRAMLAREAAEYLAAGHSGLTAYGDGPSGIHRAEGMSELLRRPLYLLEGAGDLAGYLRSFPAARPRLVDEFVSWRQERFWRRPVIGLYHTMVWEASSGGERRIIVASKQFYASHFYESAVEVLEVRKADRDRDADLTFVSRVRADIRPSGFNWLERTLIRRLVRGRLEDQFGRLRARLSEPAVVRAAAASTSRTGQGVMPRASGPRAVAEAGETRMRAGENSLEEKTGHR
jgi:hypothetical protein